jgi:hypothetical protein
VDVIDFGVQLVQTEDLDPIYSALYNLDLSRAQLSRWLIAYWAFYHAGVASMLSEIEGCDFAQAIAGGRSYPRGRERRHFRGKEPGSFAGSLLRVYGEIPEDMVDDLSNNKTFRGAVREARSIPTFGPWVAFKVADMLERMGLGNVEPAGMEYDLLYWQPIEGATMAAEDFWRRGKTGVTTVPGVFNALCGEIKHLPAPPSGDRRCGFQEAETIFCKYKASRSSHYPVGNDIREIRKSLTIQSWGETADRFLQAMPLEVN